MSDIRKWLKIMESVPAIFADQDPGHSKIKQDATVMVDPSIGGGTGRFMSDTGDGAMIDIKGIARELGSDEFGLPERDYEDGYQKGNDWFHASTNPDTIGSMNDKPEFRAGDMVKIADVYGSVIGPGMGVFVAYSTSGQECIISFDNKEIVVPTANVGAVLEQNAKDNFGEMDNDGNLSPMSLGTKNVKIEEPAMDQRDEFSKWMSAVEEALTSEGKPELAESTPVSECGCGAWNCPTCFPEQNDEQSTGCPACQGQGCQACDGSEMGNSPEMEVDGLELIGDDYVGEEDGGGDAGGEATGSGNFVVGQIVRKTELRKPGGKTSGQNSPMTYGEDNLDEEIPQGANPADYGKAGRYAQDNFGAQENVEMGTQVGAESAEDSMHKQEMAEKIMNIQNMGFSKDDKHYSEQELARYSPEEMKACYDRVMGDVSENGSKPTKTRHHLDDLDDILNPRQADLPATMGDDGDVAAPEKPMNLPAASRADTQRRVGAISPSEQMRDMMNRINPMAGAGEPDIAPAGPMGDPDVPGTEVDVPRVIGNAMQAAGMQNPSWHNVNNLPGFEQQNVRGMGRQVFGMFTSTPLEQIQTMANVQGQGPNTDAEMRAVAGWLRDNAEDLGRVDVDHGQAVPGYKPDVKEFRMNGVRFHLVRDPMGQYIYAYPDSDARLGGPPQGRPQVGGPRGQMPRLRESALKPTLFEQMQWDREIDEAFIEESSLSKLLGKEKGGQKLVQWLHRKHQLSNDANLEPNPFSERMLWKEFKAHPDNFVIISAANGVAGVKPYKKFIDDRTKDFARRGKTYNPAGDSTLPYQIIAFTDDGQQVDPNLFRQPTEPGEEPEERYADPTVMKARMGKHSGKDMQNPNNTFNLLADEIGALKTVWSTTQAVERDKISKRADMKKSDTIAPREAVQKIFTRIKPVLKTLANQAILQINKRAQRYIEGGNFEGAQKVAASGQKLKQLLVSLDTNSAINIDVGYGSRTVELSTAISKAIAQASGGSVNSDKYNQYASEAAAGNAAALRPILDGLRDQLVGL